ncbi:MAG: YhbY family RNA-binding protein [Lachnospiraceae bacterium]|nr:YhbY family RNA-binding protein [Lachnospiraceae bacterium]
MQLTSKQRAYLKSLAANEPALFQIGKSNLTPEGCQAVQEAFNTREIVKISILKGASEDPMTLAEALADRTKSTLVQLIGRKIVLYKPFKEHPQIVLPRA